MTRKAEKLFIFLCIFAMISTIGMAFGVNVFAAPDLNEVAGQTSQATSGSTSPVDGLKKAYEATSLTNNDIANAAAFTSPYVRGINFVMGCIYAVFGGLLGFITVLDLLYIAVPPIRKYLNTEQPQQGAGGMGGFGGMGMGMGMGMGGMGGAQTASTGLGRFVSDEAVAALAEAGTAQQGGGGMGGMGGMGGFGMGGFGGMGMGGMGGAQATPKTKSVILVYMKKRAFALVCFFACIVLFTSTLFTDMGLYIGSWIVQTIGSIIP